MIEHSYKSAIFQAPFGYAYHQIIQDENGVPVDYRFLEVNPSFEKLTGLKADEIIGKTVREVIPGIEDAAFNWIQHYGKIALEEGSDTFEQHAEQLGKWFQIQVYSDKKGFFTTIFVDITAQKQAQDAFKIFKSSVENATDAIGMSTPKGFHFYQNKAFDELFGFLKEHPIKEIYCDPKDWDEVFATISSGGQWIGEVKMFAKDQTVRDILLRAYANRNEQGKITSLVGIHTDITELRKAEEASQKTNELNRTIVEAMELLICKWLPDTTLTFVNDHYRKIFGLKGELDSVKWINFLPSHIHSEILLVHQQNAKDPKPFTNEHSVILPDGSLRFFQWRNSPILDHENNVIEYQSIGIDITERKHAEELAQKTKESYLGIFNTLSEAIYILDDDYTFIEVNEGAAQMYRCTREYLIGRNPAKVAAPGLNKLEDIIYKMAQVPKTGKPARFEFWGMRKTGEPFPKDVIVNKGKYFGKDVLIATARDITDRINTEKELIAAKEKAEESDRLKTAFLANMSHEIRTPMNGILGFAHILKDPDISIDKQQEYLQIIEESGHRMLNILNDLIDISRIESGQMSMHFSEARINDLMGYVYNYFKLETKQKHIKFSFHCPESDELSTIWTDKAKLNAILVNLVKNSVKFTKTGKIEFGYHLQGNYFEFYVKDTGIGIPLEYQDRIFDRFMQVDTKIATEYEGVGLGLSISKAYVQMLGGKIWVISEPGVGSEFYFTLPVNHNNDTITSDKGNIEKVDESQRLNATILIADDDDASQILLTIILDNCNCKFITAKNGKEAVDLVLSNKDIDIVMMDIKMPVMDGVTAAQKIKEIRPTLPVVAQSAYALETDRERFSNVFDDYLTKPIDAIELKEVMFKLLKNQ